MGFVFGPRSLRNLEGVHPDLVRVVRRALELSPIDFSVTAGLRSPDQQRKYVASGASKTMRSRHLTGHAVDLGAVTGVNWDTAPILALAMKHAAAELGIPIEWGAVWDRHLNDLSDDLMKEHVAYIERARGRGIVRVLADGPHFQLPWKEYPAVDAA
ncbi:M15 family metallopeptidase [Xanthobacter sp. VTT E-85241]|uniref:M15 family metallopeptidase n=1 Tax=Roseixanthobacter finlandensis TaxID=3119922 RepID=UPI00372B1DA8